MKEEELKYIDFRGTRYTVPKETVTVDGTLEFKDTNADGNVTITITKEEEETNG